MFELEVRNLTIAMGFMKSDKGRAGNFITSRKRRNNFPSAGECDTPRWKHAYNLLRGWAEPKSKAL
jgi:hypothetical protein